MSLLSPYYRDLVVQCWKFWDFPPSKEEVCTISRFSKFNFIIPHVLHDCGWTVLIIQVVHDLRLLSEEHLESTVNQRFTWSRSVGSPRGASVRWGLGTVARHLGRPEENNEFLVTILSWFSCTMLENFGISLLQKKKFVPFHDSLSSILSYRMCCMTVDELS